MYIHYACEAKKLVIATCLTGSSTVYKHRKTTHSLVPGPSTGNALRTGRQVMAPLPRQHPAARTGPSLERCQARAMFYSELKSHVQYLTLSGAPLLQRGVQHLLRVSAVSTNSRKACHYKLVLLAAVSCCSCDVLVSSLSLAVAPEFKLDLKVVPHCGEDPSLCPCLDSLECKSPTKPGELEHVLTFQNGECAAVGYRPVLVLPLSLLSPSCLPPPPPASPLSPF